MEEELRPYTYKVVEKNGYDLIYQVGQDWSQLTEYRLHDGCQVYKIEATYAKTFKPSIYYVIAKNEREAKKKFLYNYDWLKFIINISLVDNTLVGVNRILLI